MRRSRMMSARRSPASWRWPTLLAHVGARRARTPLGRGDQGCRRASCRSDDAHCRGRPAPGPAGRRRGTWPSTCRVSPPQSPPPWRSGRKPRTSPARPASRRRCRATFAGDPTQLRTALENLIANAVKFTERGKVSLAVTAAPAPRGRLRLTFAVTDSGIGISAHEIKRLFRPFAQANRDIVQKFGGAGLGLVQVRRLAKAMHGRSRDRKHAGQTARPSGCPCWSTAPRQTPKVTRRLPPARRLAAPCRRCASCASRTTRSAAW